MGCRAGERQRSEILPLAGAVLKVSIFLPSLSCSDKQHTSERAGGGQRKTEAEAEYSGCYNGSLAAAFGG